MRPVRALIFLALAAASSLAKNPADWYHSSAHKYVAGRHQEALVQAEEGLRLFPGDPALKTLVAHLRKLQDQKKQDQGQEGQSQSDQEGEEKKDKDGKGGEDGEKDDKDKQQQAEDDKEKEGKEGEENAGQPESDEGKGQDSTGEAMAPVKPGEMSKEDAERLLNSIQDDEKKEHKAQQRRHRKKIEVEQDW